MKDDDDDDGRLGGDGVLPDRPWDPEVGYGRPPKATQFKPGQSGNPKGRPKGAKTRRFGGRAHYLRDPLVAEMERKILVREAGEEIYITQMQAAARQVLIKAMSGNVRAAELVFKHAAMLQRMEQRKQDEFMEIMADRMAAQTAEMRRRRAKGITDESDILPHPDHVDVDFATGELLISGPMSPREAEVIELAHAEWTMAKQAVAELDRRLASTRSPERRVFLLEARQKIEEQIRFLADLLGEPYP